MTLKIINQLSREDVRNFYSAHWNAPFNRKKRILDTIGVFIFCCIGSSVALFSEKKPGTEITPALLILVLILIIGLTWLVSKIFNQLQYRILADRFFKDKLNSAYFEKNEYMLNDDRLEIKGEGQQSIYNWHSIVRTLQTSGYYFLYINTMSAIILPKKNLVADNDKILDELLAKNIPAEKRFSTI